MDIDIDTVRLLGAAQLFIFVASMLHELLLKTVVGSGSISDILVNISKNVTRMRISNLFALADSLGIVVLAVLFYIIFNKQYEIIALVALGFFLVEAITLAVSKIGGYALIPLSQEFVEAGAPEPSYFQTLGDFLYYGVDRQGWYTTDIPHIKPEVSKEPTILYVDDCTDAPERCQTRYRAYWTTFWCGGWWSIGWESHLRYTMAPFQPLQTRTSPLVTPHHLR